MARHRQTFEKGMRGDIDPLLTAPGTYQYAFAMQMGLTGDGRGLALTEEPPKKPIAVSGAPSLSSFRLVGLLALAVPGDYLLWLAQPDTASANRRSAICRGTYNESMRQMSLTVLYDDDLDPNGERLGLYYDNRLQTRFELETESLLRAYWNDGEAPPQSLTIGNGYNKNGVSFHSTGSYPRYWSAHSFALQPQVNWSRIGFVQLEGGGSLLSGHYRYAYRYRSPGVESPIFPLSTPLFVRQDPLQADLAKPVQMESSGVITTASMQIRVDAPDIRWQEIELLLSYSPDNNFYSDLSIVDRKPVTSTLPMTLTAISMTGLGAVVSRDRLGEISQAVERAGVMTTHKHKLILGDVLLSLPLAPAVKGTRISPLLADVALDEIGYPTLGPQGRFPLAFTYKQSDIDPPLIDSAYTRATGQPVTVEKPIVADWRDYKGVQVAHSRVGYRRGGEHYPLAILFFDMSGQPSFAWPLGVFVTPNAFDTLDNGLTYPYSPTRRVADTNNGETYVARPMGIRIDNLQIPAKYIKDADGKQLVSGFAIVRGKASGRVGPQGIALPAVWELGGRDKAIMAEPSPVNFFSDSPTVDGYRQIGNSPFPFYGSAYIQRSGWLTLHAPDLMIKPNLTTKPPEGTRLRFVGSMHGVGPNLRRVNTIATGDGRHFYVKAYRYNGEETLSFRPNARSRPKINDTLNVEGAWQFPDNKVLEKFYDKDDGITLHAGVVNQLGLTHQAKDAYLLKVDGNSMLDRGESEAMPAGYALVNMEGNVDTQAPDTIVYQWTGHYQPLNQAVLNTLPSVLVDDQLHYVFNKIDIWGGDTFLPMVDMARLIPLYNFVDDGNNFEGGYGMGLFVPIESKFNLSLRYGRTYRHVATMPTLDATGGGRGFPDGINIFQTEDWNLNAGLESRPDPVQTFAPLPMDVVLERYWPQGILWSRTKTDGQRIDAYRRIPSANLFLLEGEGGKVTGFAELFGELYVGQTGRLSRLRVNERQVQTDASGQPLVIGQASGAEISGADVLNHTTGWASPDHLITSGRAFYWVDQRSRKLFRFSQAGVECLSDRDGLHDRLLRWDMEDLTGIFDELNQVLHLSIAEDRLTYSEGINAPISCHDAWPGFAWFTYQGNIVGEVSGALSILGSTPGVGASIVYHHVPQPGQPVCFDSILLPIDKQDIDSLWVKGESNRNTTILNVPTDDRFRYRDGRTLGPLRALRQSDRENGQWVDITLLMKPDRPFRLLLSEVEWRPLHRA